MKSIYKYTFVNLADETITTILNLTKIIAIEQSDKCTALVFLEGRAEPIKLYDYREGTQIPLLIAAWEEWQQYAWVNRPGAPA